MKCLIDNSAGQIAHSSELLLKFGLAVNSEKKLDVFGVGNALVDVLAQVEDQFVADIELAKGSMTLMDTEQQSSVLSGLENQSLRLASGGSAANTMVAIAQSGGSGVYMGKVAHDTHGEFYKKDMEEAGILFPVAMAPESSLPTGSCVVLTTPDAERTMCTHLGISTSLTKSEVDFDMLANSKMSYVEGYLWDAENPRAACVETFEQCKKLNIPASFTFSDSFLVDRFGDDFKKIVSEYCDVIFCNADEIRKFYGIDDIDECNSRIGKDCKLVFVTDGANGCFVVENGAVQKVEGFGVKAIDTVGAGDAFAGGVLYGITNGMDSLKAAKWGNYFASKVVERIGPRLDQALKSDLEAVVA